MINKISPVLRSFLHYGLIIGAIFLSLSLGSTILKFIAASEKLKEAESELEELENQNRQLQKEAERIGGQEFIEKVARDKLGFAYEGETVAVLPDEEVVKKASPARKELEEVLPDPNWKKWIKLFL